MVTLSGIASDINYGLGLLSSFGQQVDVVGIYANGSVNASPSIQASPIINSLIGNTSAASGFGQMFANARPMQATIRETSKVMEHPGETGIPLADHHVINPIEIDLPLIVSSQFYPATYTQVRQAFITATPLSVKTRVGVYSDMIIMDMPHEEKAEMYDVITIFLRLRQIIYVNPNGTASNGFQPLDPLNSNSLATGLQLASSLGSSLLAQATAIASYANLGKFH